MSKGYEVGINLSNAITEMLHMMCDKNIALRVLNALIEDLENRRQEFK